MYTIISQQSYLCFLSRYKMENKNLIKKLMFMIHSHRILTDFKSIWNLHTEKKKTTNSEGIHKLILQREWLFWITIAISPSAPV